MKTILFCLEQCIKCGQVKELVKNKNVDIDIVTFPHCYINWNSVQIVLAKKCNILEDLQATAPILVLEDGTKIIGQLRIMRWLQNEKT